MVEVIRKIAVVTIFLGLINAIILVVPGWIASMGASIPLPSDIAQYSSTIVSYLSNGLNYGKIFANVYLCNANQTIITLLGATLKISLLGIIFNFEIGIVKALMKIFI